MRSITTLAITILQGAALSAQESAVLRLAPPAGQVSHYRYEMRMWMQVPGMPVGDSSAPSISMTGGFTQSVTHVDGDAHESRTAYDSLKLDAPMMGSMGGQPEHMLKGLVPRPGAVNSGNWRGLDHAAPALAGDEQTATTPDA